jgi:hypothetical protein
VSRGRGIPSYLALRVLDNDTGVEIVNDLPHLHQVTWQKRAYQPGQPASSMVGSGTILLPAPGTAMFRAHADTYRSLAIGQRVEAYMGDHSGSTPAFSGIIVPPVERAMNGPWKVNVVDSTYMLQRSKTVPGEGITLGNGETSWFLVSQLLGTMERQWADDFNNWNSTGTPGDPTSASYTNSGFSFSSADPFLGLPCLTCPVSASEARLTTTTSWGVARPLTGEFGTAVVSTQGVMVGATGASPGAVVGYAGIWLMADATTQNGILCDAVLVQQSIANWYSVDVRILERTAGTYTLRQSVNCLTDCTSPLEFQLQALLFTLTNSSTSAPGSGQQMVKVIFNGKDVECQYAYNLSPPGRVGIRGGAISGSGTISTYFHRLQFQARTSGDIFGIGTFGTNRFAFGDSNSNGPVMTSPGNSSGQTHLDQFALAATATSYYMRMTPGRGYKSDTIDFGHGATVDRPTPSGNPGLDLSAKIVLREGVNVVADGTEVSTVPEQFDNGIQVQSLPGGDSGGIVTWGSIGASGAAVLEGSLAEMGAPGFSLLSRYASAIHDRRLDPLRATSVRVVRTADWIALNNGLGPRECDTLLVDLPTLGVNNQQSVLVGFDFEEGSGTQLCYFDALPAGTLTDPLSRIRLPIDFLTATFQRR